MTDVWDRRTEVVDPEDLSADAVAALEKVAAGRGIPWAPGTVRLAWATVSTTEVGRLRKRTRTVRHVGTLGDDVLAWAVSDDGAPPGALVVRRSRVEVADGHLSLSGIAPQLLARAGASEAAADGVTVRGDLGGRDLASAFLPLGPGPAADQVRAALLTGV